MIQKCWPVSIYSICLPDEEPEIRQRQEADFKKIFEKLDPEIPFICLSGNHDVGNQPTMETIELLVSLVACFPIMIIVFWDVTLCNLVDKVRVKVTL